MKFDVIRAVEACYAPVRDDRGWLEGVLAALEPLNEGPWSAAWVFRELPDGSRKVECSAGFGAIRPGERPSRIPDFEEIHKPSTPPDLARRLYAPTPRVVDYALRRARRIGGPVVDDVRSQLQGWGVAESLGIFATEPDGRTLLIVHGTPEGGRLLSARIVHQLRLLSAHLSSSMRLRRACGIWPDAPPEAPAEAKLEGGGRVVDAVGGAQTEEARWSLADAVQRLDRARGALRRTDPEEALRLWQGLVEGTWSLVDQYDSDGKRYVLARRNEPSVRDPKALTQRERSVAAFAAMGHQNKFIAYLLGLSTGAVSGHLRSAERKLGTTSRAELVRCFAPFVMFVPAAIPPGGDRRR